MHPTVNIRGLNHERIALPTATRVAKPLSDGRCKMRPPIQRNDARVVDHLDKNHHVSGRLQDEVVVVVEAGQHRSRHSPGDAPVVHAHVLP